MPINELFYIQYFINSNLPKNNEELESTSEIIQNDTATSKNSISLIVKYLLMNA